MQDEVDAQNAAAEEAETEEDGEGETDEDTEELPEGTLVDPNTGESVTMPTEEEAAAAEEEGILGGITSPILPEDGSSEGDVPEDSGADESADSGGTEE